MTRRRRYFLQIRNMSDDWPLSKTSSEPATGESSTEIKGSTCEPLGASPACSVDMSNPSQTRCSGRDTAMMCPEEKLIHFDSQAQAQADSQQFDACIQSLVRCVALTRLVYEEEGLKLAQAHARLAKAYLQFKGWALQAQEHVSTARELLPFCSPSTGREERLQVLTCLLTVHLTQAGAAQLLDNLEEAESSFLKAERVVEELYQQEEITQEDKVKTEIEISTALSRVYQHQGRAKDALIQCQRSLELLEGRDNLQQTCAVYKEMAAVEQAQGRLDQATEHLSKAHAIAVSQIPGGLDGADMAHSLALVLSAAQPHHNDSAARYFKESLNAYRSSLGPQDPVFLNVQDDYCRFLLVNRQHEECVEIQRASLSQKRAAFGDLSAEVADTLQLIGGVEMTMGRIRQAHRSMTKCLEIQNILYGSQHKKTKATQRTVEMLAQAPEVAGRRMGEGVKTRPPFRTAVPFHSTGEGNTSISYS